MEQAIFEEKPWSERLRGLFWVILIIGIIVLVVILLRGIGTTTLKTENSYQAVFLDNGQVYFGKLKTFNRDFISLTDVYYLKAGRIRQGEAGGAFSGENQIIDLVKLGAELHAPEDQIIINKAHILYYEALGENGEVMNLIRRHKGQK